MIGWLVLAVYLVGWAYWAVYWARKDKEREIRAYGVETASRHQGLTLLMGVLIAIPWPVWAPFAAAHAITQGRIMARIMRTDIEREYDRREELAKLRAQARAYGLPYPGGEE
jgi:hypothetical protein